MSLDHLTYLGPYLRCQNRLERKPFEVLDCLNEACPVYLLTEGSLETFCSKCGQKRGPRIACATGSVVRVQDLYRDGEALAHVLRLPQYVDIFIPNVERPGKPARQGACNELEEAESEEPISGAQIMLEGVWFQEQFRPEIQIARQAFGDHAVRLCWGFLTYVG